MGTNLSKFKRQQLLTKADQLKAFMEENNATPELLACLRELTSKAAEQQFGLVFEEHCEEIDKILLTHEPILTEEKDLFIDNGGPVNFIIEGDNLAALTLLDKTHRGKIDVIYIDPPYNTGAKDWKYDNNYVDDKDLFRHSKWLSFMKRRLDLACDLLSPNGAIVIAIDENEVNTLGLLIDDCFYIGDYNKDLIVIMHNPGGIQGTNFSYNHEYAYFIYPKKSHYISKEKRDDGDLTPLRDWGKENSKRLGSPNCFFPIIINKEKQVVGFGDVPDNDFHPEAMNVQNGELIYIYPIDKNGVERRWRFARNTIETIADELEVIESKGYLEIQRGKKDYTRKTIWDNSKFNANVYGTQLVSKIIATKFPFPKSLHLVKECLLACEQHKNSVILDFFAGSGTTGHAVLELNKEDGGNRRFILCNCRDNGNDICHEVTYERIKTVITGARKDGSKYGEPMKASLKYDKIDYVSI